MSFRWKRVWALCRKDFLESLRNRTILITLLLPLAASLLFAALDAAQVPHEFHIGVIEDGESFQRFVQRNIVNFSVQPVTNPEEARVLVEDGTVDAVLLVQGADDFLVFIDSARPIKFYALTENMRLLVEMYLGTLPQYYLEFVPLQEPTVSQSLLPVWMTLTLTMIGVMVLSGIFAEEKDTKTLDALLMAPMHRWEILWGKGLFGVLLSLATLLFMAALNGVLTLELHVVLLTLTVSLLGAISFTALGILIGTVSESQSAARSIGTVVYLPLLFPTLIYDLSPFTQRLASFVPTYYVFRALEKLFYYGANLADLVPELTFLLFSAIGLSLVTYFFFKRMMFRE